MVQLSILAEMLDKDLTHALSVLRELKMSRVDLKNHVFTCAIEALDDRQRRQLAALLEETSVEVYCFASMLGYMSVGELDEHEYENHLSRGVDNLLRTAEHVRPQMVRLLACRVAEKDTGQRLEHVPSWVYGAYRQAIERLNAEGLHVTIENEPDSVLSTPAEVLRFFDRLEVGRGAGFTWDIQNMWQAGTAPSVEVYHDLKPVIDYVHVKGGRDAPTAPGKLVYRATLANASWPVESVLKLVIQDGVSPVICLNTSHGEIPEGYEFSGLVGTSQLSRAEADRDAAFLRHRFEEIE